MATVPKRPLTDDEKADATRLNAAWQAYKAKCKEKGESPSQAWLGSVTGLGGQSAVGQYLRGLIPINLKALVAICNAIGARPEEISPRLTDALTEISKNHQVRDNPNGNGRSSNEAEAYNPPAIGDNFEAGPDLRPRKYPEISWVQAGMWTVIGENFVREEAAAWHYCPFDLGEKGFVLRVRGTSMTAPGEARHTFPEGTLLFVHPDLEAVPGKFVIVARNGNEATFKRLIIEEGELFLEALNPAWQPRYVRLESDHHICGVVVFSGMPL